MTTKTAAEQLVDEIRASRCYNHPVFHHWADVHPNPDEIAALFHQIQMFCASTRPGHAFPEALSQLDMERPSELLTEIVESEEDHGPELARMAGFIVNQAAGEKLYSDIYDQQDVERRLKEKSDKYLAKLPGYTLDDGLTAQARRAIAVFDRRKRTDRESTFRNLGTAVALEMVSNNQIIPGEKHCLVDSGAYGASLEQDEMHYLLEHWGEAGAEQQHEKNAIEAIGSVMTEETEPLIREGAVEFLESLSALWDLLDAALLRSGAAGEEAARG